MSPVNRLDDLSPLSEDKWGVEVLVHRGLWHQGNKCSYWGFTYAVDITRITRSQTALHEMMSMIETVGSSWTENK